MPIMGGGVQPLTRRVELYDYTAFSCPTATLTDTSSEEIEIDQGLSLQGRRGRRLFGIVHHGLAFKLIGGLITDTADAILRAQMMLATRTGAFDLSDPELLWKSEVDLGMNVTEGSQSGYVVEETGIPPGGEVYVAPRLFWRLTNDIDISLLTDEIDVRIASVSQPLSFQVFIELLERFADVTLL